VYPTSARRKAGTETKQKCPQRISAQRKQRTREIMH